MSWDFSFSGFYPDYVYALGGDALSLFEVLQVTAHAQFYFHACFLTYMLLQYGRLLNNNHHLHFCNNIHPVNDYFFDNALRVF